MTRQAQLEKEQIVQAVNQLAKNLAAKLDRELGLPCSSKMVGSAAEKTRCFQPDEFDFLLIFDKVTTYFQHHSYGERFVLSENPDDTTPHSKNPMKRFVHDKREDGTKIGQRFLLPNLIQEKIYHTIRSALGSTNYTVPNKWFVQSTIDETDVFNRCDARLSAEPTGFYNQNAKFSTIRLVWRGPGRRSTA